MKISGDTTTQTKWVVSYNQLGLLLLAFSLGCVTSLFFVTSDPKPTVFSTSELIGFVLSVILSAAGIVLSVSAIALGKFSELAMIQRSDESIKLQNEVFIKTTDALQRIQASTGVTEKRIEDIISGRVGDLSHRIVETVKERGSVADPAQLEKDISNSLQQALRSLNRPAVAERQERIRRTTDAKREAEYQAAHKKLLLSFSNRDGVKTEKLGHGSLSRSAYERYDAIFHVGSNKVGVVTFRPNVHEEVFKAYLSAAASDLTKGLLDRVRIIGFLAHGCVSRRAIFDTVNAYLKSDIANRLTLVEFAQGDVEQEGPKVVL